MRTTQTWVAPRVSGKGHGPGRVGAAGGSGCIVVDTGVELRFGTWNRVDIK